MQDDHGHKGKVSIKAALRIRSVCTVLDVKQEHAKCRGPQLSFGRLLLNDYQKMLTQFGPVSLPEQLCQLWEKVI